MTPGSLSGVIALAGVPVVPGRGPARDAAARELSKAVYQAAKPGLYQRFTSWLGNLVAKVFASAGDSGGGWFALGLALATFVVAALVWWRLGAPARARRAAHGRLFDTARPMTATEHRAAAERLAASGAWAEAIRERLRAIIRDLEERAILDVRPGRTALDAAQQAGVAFPSHAEALGAAALLFDDVWYGEVPADSAGYARISEVDAAVHSTKPVLVDDRY